MSHTPTGDAPGNEGPPLSPLNPESMHRAEQDDEARATSPEFHERPADGSFTAPPAGIRPPAVPPDGERHDA